jgi:hypothetical protein
MTQVVCNGTPNPLFRVWEKHYGHQLEVFWWGGPGITKDNSRIAIIRCKDCGGEYLATMDRHLEGSAYTASQRFVGPHRGMKLSDDVLKVLPITETEEYKRMGKDGETERELIDAHVKTHGEGC